MDEIERWDRMSVSIQVVIKDVASRKLARIAAAYEKMERAVRKKG